MFSPRSGKPYTIISAYELDLRRSEVEGFEGTVFETCHGPGIDLARDHEGCIYVYGETWEQVEAAVRRFIEAYPEWPTADFEDECEWHRNNPR